jgi:hypothetical protein
LEKNIYKIMSRWAKPNNMRHLILFENFRVPTSRNFEELVFHGGPVDFNKPMYFSSSEVVASSYGEVSGPYRVRLKKPLILDFSDAEGWWLPEESANPQIRKLGMNLKDFDRYSPEIGLSKNHVENIKAIKTDHFVRYAMDDGRYDGVIFHNIQDAGSWPTKDDKYIRATNIVALNPKKSVNLL